MVLAASTARTPPTSPDEGAIEPCWDSDGGRSEFGRVYNRFLWCQRGRMGGIIFKSKGVPLGRASFIFRAVAYGRDDGDRSVKVFMRAEKDSISYDGSSSDLRSAVLHLWADCDDWLSGCSSGGATVGNTFDGWDDDDSWHSWTVRSSEVGAGGPDAVRRHLWHFKVRTFRVGSFDPGPLPIAKSHTIRCDSATMGFPKSRSKACIFDDVIPHMQYSVQNPKVEDVARHIQCAQNPPCLTWPLKDGKSIPGRFIDGNRDAPGLHRIMESQPEYGKNSYQKTQACNRGFPYGSLGLPASMYDPTPPLKQQCDEYPFASTKEGAGVGDWNFSVMGVNGRQNGCAGAALKRYYKDDRILVWRQEVPDDALDTFYVRINDNNEDGGDAYCADQDEGGGDPNQPPTVNAGADMTGDEGFATTLTGSASDPEGSVAVHWTYVPGADTDRGAACHFSQPYSPVTDVTCTDDGTFTLTLTASDGVNAAVGDSATLTVRNVDPRVRRLLEGMTASEGKEPLPLAEAPTPGIATPQPWQVYRAGEPVTLTANFTDPGLNDTHECVVDWDDGRQETFEASGLTCERAHTYQHPGMYTIKTRVDDDDTGTDGDSVMVIVYDPDAGFVTGGGFIDSPPGALAADQQATGKGHFTFNPMYHKADEGPVPGGGKVSFRVDGTAFDLDSRSMEWLVVAPDGKIAVKGKTGDAHGYVLYGYDEPDKFRIVVWRLADGPIPGSDLVYDNHRGADYDLDVAGPQDITGGSIKVH
jgi:hypothetical protein